MFLLGEFKVELTCPERETSKNCLGKIEVVLQQYRIARGRGTFVIKVSKSPVICNRCGRVFQPQGIFPGTDDYFFSPLKGKIKIKELKQAIGDLSNPLLQKEILDKFRKFKKREKKFLEWKKKTAKERRR